MKLSKAKSYMNELGKSSVPFLFIIDFEKKKPLIFPISEVPDGILFYINGITNDGAKRIQKKSFSFESHPFSFSDYKRAYDQVLVEINYGNSFLLNLTFPTEITSTLSIEDIYHQSLAKYKLLLPGQCVVFSPEIFVQIESGKIRSHPMKGTIDASIPNARNILLHDRKEIAEHFTIVDLIRNDLSMVAKNVTVKKFRYVDKLQTHAKPLLQVSSEIEGDLSSNYAQNIGDIIMGLLPAGSVSGAPKKKTLEIIKEIEGIDRGYYTGIFGYFDGNKLDSGVMIRYIEKSEKGLFYRSGGGVTADSNPNAEYNELLDKIYVPINRKHQNTQRSRLQYSLPQ